MAPNPIIFALANPTPEILPPDAERLGAFIVATGRSDFANQINNSLVFPGIFRGLLATGVQSVTMEVKQATALAIANSVRNPSPKNIIPESLDPDIPHVIVKEIRKIQNKGAL